MVTRGQTKNVISEEIPSFMKVKNILNICLTIFITINLALEYEGQSSTFAFVTDAVDCGLFLCCFCVLIFAIVIDIQYQ